MGQVRGGWRYYPGYLLLLLPLYHIIYLHIQQGKFIIKNTCFQNIMHIIALCAVSFLFASFLFLHIEYPLACGAVDELVSPDELVEELRLDMHMASPAYTF